MAGLIERCILGWAFTHTGFWGLSHDFPGGSDDEASAYNAGDLGSIPGSGRSPGKGSSNPCQYSCLETPTDGGAWEATVPGLTKSRTRLSDFIFTFFPSFSSVQLLSWVLLFVTPWTEAHQASLSITSSWSRPIPMSIKSVMPSNHLILCRPLLLLPSIFPSIRVFSNESAVCIRWPKYWSWFS